MAIERWNPNRDLEQLFDRFTRIFGYSSLTPRLSRKEALTLADRFQDHLMLLRRLRLSVLLEGGASGRDREGAGGGDEQGGENARAQHERELLVPGCPSGK